MKTVHSSGALFLYSWQGWEVTIAQCPEDGGAPSLLNKAKPQGDRWQIRFTTGLEEAVPSLAFSTPSALLAAPGGGSVGLW